MAFSVSGTQTRFWPSTIRCRTACSWWKAGRLITRWKLPGRKRRRVRITNFMSSAGRWSGARRFPNTKPTPNSARRPCCGWAWATTRFRRFRPPKCARIVPTPRRWPCGIGLAGTEAIPRRLISSPLALTAGARGCCSRRRLVRKPGWNHRGARPRLRSGSLVESSAGVRSVLSEMIAYGYARFLFSPSAEPPP